MENRQNQLMLKLIISRLIIVLQKISNQMKSKASGSTFFMPMVAQRNWFLRPVAHCVAGA